MTARHFIVATAGHVDHGKSALVKALTGIDPDRLPEEKARGITIDLGFAHLDLPARSASGECETPNAKRETFHLGIVDVPGHEDFVKNMVAGVGSIDLALFVVAADDGWMPQTEEHLQILTYLGVRRAVVALTKIDLAESNEPPIIAGMRGRLSETPFSEAPIVPTSVITGRGLDELKTALTAVLSQTPPPRDIGKPRLPVDRVFTLRGIGTVVTGTLTGGALRRGQAVLIQPAGRATRIRNLQTHSQDVEVAGSGTRTALNLPDLAVAAKRESAASSEAVHRGEVVTLADLGTPSDTLDVLLTKSPRLTGTKSGAARPLRDGTLVRVHHGSGHFPARVLLLEGGQIGPGEQGLAQLRCPEPVFAFVGDRFIVRDWSEQNTLGGGIVLDADADRRRFHSDAQKKLLAGRAQSPHDTTVCIETQLERDRAARRSNLLVKSSFSAAEISEAVDRLASVGKTVLVGDLVADAVWWKALQRRAAGAIDAEHKKNPQHVGLPLNELRATVDSDLPSPELFPVLVNDLSRNGFVQAGVAIKRATHCPALPPQLQTAGAKLRTALAAKPFEPPSRKELAPDSLAQQALRFLRETGEVVELGDDVVLMSESFARMREDIVKFIRAKGPATVSDLRQVLGTTRRIMVPVLERLDREGVTARQGEKRVLRTH